MTAFSCWMKWLAASAMIVSLSAPVCGQEPGAEQDEPPVADEPAPEQPARGLRIAPARLAPRAVVNPQVIRRVAGAARLQAQQQANNQEAPNDEPRGALEDLANVLNAMVDVTFRNDRLVLTPKSGYREFQQALFSNTGVFGGGSTSSSGDGQQITMSINWQRISGTARIGMQAPTNGEMKFFENDYLRRSLTCSWTADGTLQFSVWSPREPLFLELKSTADGPIQLVYLNANGGGMLRSERFTEILQALEVDDRKEMLGLVRRLGLPLPATPYEPAVMNAVKQRLSIAIGSDEAAAFRELVAGFDENSFEAREACSARVKQEFARWKESVIASLNDESFSLEARSRLREIFRDLIPKEERLVIETAIDLDLANDPSYLVFLMTDSSEEEVPLIVARLQALTSLQHRADVELWRQAVVTTTEESAVANLPLTASPKPTSESGQLEKLAPSLQKLASFQTDEGRLVYAPEMWREVYGGRTIGEVNQEIQEKLDQYQLPRSLWQGEQLERLGDAAYPIALVMGLETAVRALPSQAGNFVQSSSGNNVNPNPQFTFNGIGVRLVTQNIPNRMNQVNRNQGNQPAEPIHFDFSISELVGSGRELRFGTSMEQGSCHFGYRDLSSGLLFTVAGNNDSGWTVQVMSVEGALVDQDASIDALRDRHPEIFNELIGPQLLQLGIENPWAQAAVEATDDSQ